MASRRLFWLTLGKRILIHLLLWFLLLANSAWSFGVKDNPLRAFANSALFLPGLLLIVYSLLYFLVPRYLLKRKFLAFFTGLVIIIAVCMVYTVLAQVSINGGPNAVRGMSITRGSNILPYINAAGIALSIRLLLYWFQQKKLAIEVERQKDEVELKLLKAQLHPNFLFNTLNNLYLHTLKISPKSPEIVMKLSELLRFMIYESNTPKIPLTLEIKLLQDYIALEELRFGSRLDISVSISGNIENYQIAPFLLLPFVENAFKHGTGKQLDQSWISLNISLENSIMYFKLVNSIEPENKIENKNADGEGLLKVKRRLEHLYKDKYNFETRKLEEAFVVDLEVTLEQLEERYMDNDILSAKKIAVSLT